MNAPMFILILCLCLLSAVFCAGCLWGLKRNHEADRNHESGI